MRIPYPERISYTGALTAAVVLLSVQLLEHTGIYFALCCFAYIMVVTAGFNIAGGLYRPGGAYIFFNATLTLLVGLAVKAVLAEPADSNLATPLHSIQIYLSGAIAMLVAAYFENRFRKPVSLVVTLFPLANLRAAYIGSVVIGIAAKILYMVAPDGSSGSFFVAFRNADQFIPFAMILGVMYTVRTTNGKKSVTPGLALLFVAITFLGLLSFSKQGLFTPAFCWVIGLSFARYNLKPFTMIFAVSVIFVLLHYGTPYSQVGRDYERSTWAQTFNLSWYLITHMDMVIAQNDEANKANNNAAFRMEYFNHSEGIFDRLEMLSPDDALIFETDRDGTFGYEPTKEYFENLIPHIIWADKPTPYFGNVYAHQIGIISPDDGTTAVSFGISADAYHQGGIYGVVVAETLILSLSFIVMSRVLGDVRDHPVGLVAVLTMAHFAPEGGLGYAIVFIQLSMVLLVLAFTCTYILPIFASIFEPRKPSNSIPHPAVVTGRLSHT